MTDCGNVRRFPGRKAINPLNERDLLVTKTRGDVKVRDIVLKTIPALKRGDMHILPLSLSNYPQDSVRTLFTSYRFNKVVLIFPPLQDEELLTIYFVRRIPDSKDELLLMRPLVLKYASACLPRIVDICKALMTFPDHGTSLCSGESVDFGCLVVLNTGSDSIPITLHVTYELVLSGYNKNLVSVSPPVCCVATVRGYEFSLSASRAVELYILYVKSKVYAGDISVFTVNHLRTFYFLDLIVRMSKCGITQAAMHRELILNDVYVKMSFLTLILSQLYNAYILVPNPHPVWMDGHRRYVKGIGEEPVDVDDDISMRFGVMPKDTGITWSFDVTNQLFVKYIGSQSGASYVVPDIVTSKVVYSDDCVNAPRTAISPNHNRGIGYVTPSRVRSSPLKRKDEEVLISEDLATF